MINEEKVREAVNFLKGNHNYFADTAEERIELEELHQKSMNTVLSLAQQVLQGDYVHKDSVKELVEGLKKISYDFSAINAGKIADEAISKFNGGKK